MDLGLYTVRYLRFAHGQDEYYELRTFLYGVRCILTLFSQIITLPAAVLGPFNSSEDDLMGPKVDRIGFFFFLKACYETHLTPDRVQRPEKALQTIWALRRTL